MLWHSSSWALARDEEGETASSMNNHNHNNGEPRLDETPAIDIISVSYCIGRMDVPIRRGTCPPFRSTGSLPEHGSIAIEQQMKSKIGETGNFTRRTRDRMPDFAYMIISLLHANPILPIFRSPERLLVATGLGAGQSVPEVGGGPGFFTIPAAEIIGITAGLCFIVDLYIYKDDTSVFLRGWYTLNPAQR